MKNKIYQVKTVNMKKLSFFLGTVCLILLAAAGPLGAEIRVEGRGNVWARGNGSITVQGGSPVEITGSGLLKVSAGTIFDLLDGQGERLETDSGEVLYINFDGKAKVHGTDVKLEFNGANIVLNVRGSGSVTLKGVGIYLVGITLGSWHPLEKTIITFFAPAEQ
jgi:hypothetical protein